MANKVTLKRSSVAGKVPQTSDLDFGEVALNFTDGRLYFRNSNDQIEFFETPSDASEFDVLNDDLNLGSVTSSVTQVLNLGSVTEAANDSYDLGRVVTSGILFPELFLLPSYPESNLPPSSFIGQLIYVNNANVNDYIEDGYIDDGYVSGVGNTENGTIAFSDGEKWNQFSTVATTGSYDNLTDKPNLASVATSGSYNDLTGTPDLTVLATETYVDTAVSDLVGSAPETLDTLNELAVALDSDPNFATTITNELSLKADSSSLSNVATTGDYDDLNNKPNAATTGKAIAMSIVFG